MSLEDQTDKLYRHKCQGVKLYRGGYEALPHFYMSRSPEPLDEICPLHIASIDDYIQKYYPNLKKRKENDKSL